MASVEQACEADEPRNIMAACENQENKDPGDSGEVSLRKMFVEGTTSIATHRTENLFQQLESSSLTEEQQKIIEQRVALQRKMFEQYEKRERQRKVAELQDVVPGLTAEEADKALDFCGGREDDAAAQLVSDAAFLRRVKAALHGAPGAAEAEVETNKKEAATSRPTSRARPVGPRPKLIDPSSLGSSVFMGAFRGKGYNSGPKAAPRPPPRGGKKAAASLSDQEGDGVGGDDPAAPLASAGSGEEGVLDLVAAGSASHVDVPTEEEQGVADGETTIAVPVSRKPRSRRGASAAQRAQRAGCTGRGAAKAEPSDVEDAGGDAEGEDREGSEAAQGGEEGQQAEGVAAEQQPGDQGLAAAEEEEGKKGRGAGSGKEEGGSTPAASTGPPGSTPVTVPRRYALAVETSDGGYRPATASEIRVLSEGEPLPDAAPQPTPTSGDRAPAGAEEATKSVSAASAQKAALAKTALLLAKMAEDKAVAWLARMVEAVRSGSLEALEAVQPEKAAALRAKLGSKGPASQPALEEAPSNESARTTEAPGAAATAAQPAQPVEGAGQVQEAASDQAHADSGDQPSVGGFHAKAVVATAEGDTCKGRAAGEEGAELEEGKAEEAAAGGQARRPVRAAAKAVRRGAEEELDPGEDTSEGEQGSDGDEANDGDFMEEDTEGGEEEGNSTDDDDFQVPVTRPTRRAASARAPTSAPPSRRAPRAAKAAASALFQRAASLSESDDDFEEDDSEGGAGVGSAADSEAEAAVRSSRRSRARRGGKAAATATRRVRKRAASASVAEGAGGDMTEGESAEGDGTVEKAGSPPLAAVSSPGNERAAGNSKRGEAVAGAEDGACQGSPPRQLSTGGKGKAPRGRAPPAKKQKTSEAGAAGEAAPDMVGNTAAVSSGQDALPDEQCAMEVEGAAPSTEQSEGAEPATEGATAEGAGRGDAQQEVAAELEQAQRAERAAAAASAAISSRGHTCRGRVKQKSHKSADLVEVGKLRADAGWHNAGYIFPEGFVSRTLFRSSVALDQLCVHECFIIGRGGQHWPQPTFKVVALDRPEEPLVAKSCTGCWTGVLKRINAEIEARRKQGEDLPPPPKTAIAGPEYFGLNQPNIQEAIEALDPERACTQYWAGKDQRERAAAGLPVAAAAAGSRPPRAPRSSAPSAGKRGGKGRKRRADSESEEEEGEDGEEDETAYMTNRWSSVSRTERYKKRIEAEGGDVSALDEDNPLPDLIDPITLEPVVRPAISPYGHVMGMATWKAVLAESSSCPFTKQPLQWEQCKMLTQSNFHLYKHKIIR